MLMASALLALTGAAAHARAPESDVAPVLISTTQFREMADAASRYPLFRQELARVRRDMDAALAQPIDVPTPKDVGGGYTHEQHKRNYKTIYASGLLFRLTGDERYRDHARRLLLAYAELYPGLGLHPAKKSKEPGRLFWQILNEGVWLVYAIQGYDAIRSTLPPDERQRIDDRLLRPMTRFLSEESPESFDDIHNHATWLAAGVGMTGYVLRDPALVRKALLGLDGSGRYGFLRQMDLLFSPDGYYAEGPYYQRYALQPFVVLARAVEQNEPQRRIFERRDGVLLKAVRTAIQLTYRGYFFPLNDALKDKGLWTDELYYGVAIAYAQSKDDTLLSIAELQGRTVLSPDGLALAKALAEGRARPFPFASLRLRDGPDGDRGDLVVLRDGDSETGQALVMKNTAHGMGHGHFDKLAWMLYDNGEEVITDYGAARFLNVEAKQGGRYLPENDSYAQQTIAHNTLVVDEHSHFDADWKRGEQLAPTPLFFEADADTQIAAARMDGAYESVSFTRTLAMLRHADFEHPVVVDLLKVSGSEPAQYDLPLHYRGQITEVGFPVERELEARPVLGKRNGYQHLWVDATGTVENGEAFLTWLLGDRFYTYRFIPPPDAALILAETGANDPDFNLRHEPVLIQRVEDATTATFVSLLEPHGRYDGAAETVRGEPSQISALEHFAGDDGDLIRITTAAGHRVLLAVAAGAARDRTHRIMVNGRPYEWQGYYARFDE
jgi:oligo-alginate lyase